jgi:hypothetical protein
MMKRHVFAILLLSTALAVHGQAPQAARPDAAQEKLRRDIEYLASDKLEGRRTGEKGAILAADYIAETFAKLKLTPGVPAGKGKSTYRQPFPYVTGVTAAKGGNNVRFRLREMDGRPSEISNTSEVKPAGFSMNGETADAPIVFAGFGIDSSELKYSDYSGVDAAGKVVLAFDGTPENDNPHSPFNRFDARTKALIARDKGAAGLILITRLESVENDPLARLKYDQTLGESAVPVLVVSRSAAGRLLQVTPAELNALEGANVAKNGHAAMLNAALERVSPSVSFKVDLVKARAEAYNVMGILSGTDPVLRNEAIVIGAHYDHLGRGGQGSLDVNSTRIHYGADDNASGTAAILELARQFAKARNHKRTIIFIAFSGEEEGLIGSKYYVEHPVFPLENTAAMINLDMVGRLKDGKLQIGGIGTASEWRDLVNAENMPPAAVSGGVRNAGSSAFATRSALFDLQLNEDGFGPSDHSSFYGKKVPVLFFFTGTHSDYHKPSDTAEKINYEGENAIVYYVGKIIDAVDRNPQRPAYAVARSSGMGGGRSGFNISLGTVPSYVESSDGLVLDGVRDNSPAAKAGLKAGDKVVRLAGKDIRNVMDYTYVLGEMKAGQEYEIVVIRGGERVTAKIVPVKR